MIFPLSSQHMKKVALVTDSLTFPGGHSRVLLSLLKIWPDADIYTSVFDREQFPGLENQKVFTTFINSLPGKKFWRKHYSILSPLAFEQFDFSGYDLVVSLSAGAAKGVITNPATKHLGIILTPPRAYWGERFKRQSFMSKIIGMFEPITGMLMRIWDFEAAYRPDDLIAISKFIQKRVQKIYKRDSKVVYPGVNLEFWKPEPKKKREDFYLVVSRLESYKRIDLAVKAANKLKCKLVVIGDGPELQNLKSIAGSTITLKGHLSDEEVRDHMQRCRALIFPGLEDFGMTPVEAMACGSPVIAYNRGGTAETVINEETGIHFEVQEVDEIIDSIKKCERSNFDNSQIVMCARMFSEKKFIQNIEKLTKA